MDLLEASWKVERCPRIGPDHFIDTTVSIMNHRALSSCSVSVSGSRDASLRCFILDIPASRALEFNTANVTSGMASLCEEQWG